VSWLKISPKITFAIAIYNGMVYNKSEMKNTSKEVLN